MKSTGFRVYRFSGLHEKERGMGNAFHFRSLGLELMAAAAPGESPAWTLNPKLVQTSGRKWLPDVREAAKKSLHPPLHVSLNYQPTGVVFFFCLPPAKATKGVKSVRGWAMLQIWSRA